MNKKKIIFFKKSLDLLLLNKTKKDLSFFLLYLLVAAILEFISFGTIPIIINSLINPELIKLNIINIFGFSSFWNNISNQNFVIIFLIICALIFLIKNIFLTYFSYFEGNLLKKIVIQMQTTLIKKYAYLDYFEFKNYNSSKIVNEIVIQTERARAFITRLIIIVKELIVLLSLLTILFIIDPIITFNLTAIFTTFTIVFYMIFKKKNTYLGSNLSKFDDQKLKILSHLFYAFRDVKMFSKEDFFINQYLEKLVKSEEAKKFIYILSKIPKFFLETVALITIILIFIFFQPIVGKIDILIPIIGTISIFIIRLIPVYNSITSSLNVVKFNWPIYSNIINNIENLEFSQDKKNSLSNQNNILFNEKLEFKNVSFYYEDAEQHILKNANFCFYKGKVNGIVGVSGVGKSTLVDLLTSLLKPKTGEIFADGKDIQKISGSWRKLIGYVPQSINLIDGTIAENIGFAVDVIDKKKLLEIIKKVNLQKFVESLKEGVNTKIGERGTKISGGQKQRLGIARALYNNPQILVLDESTNALDSQTERKILEDITNLKSEITIIIISHKENTMKYCDNVFKIENGIVKQLNIH